MFLLQQMLLTLLMLLSMLLMFPLLLLLRTVKELPAHHHHVRVQHLGHPQWRQGAGPADPGTTHSVRTVVPCDQVVHLKMRLWIHSL